MAYHTPHFNLLANVWRVAGPIIYPPMGPPALTVACQLRMYKTAFELGAQQGPAQVIIAVLVPKGTDLRPELGFVVAGASGDVIEVPAASGRYYRVQAVDDVAKGFANEYRQALCRQVFFAGPYPIP